MPYKNSSNSFEINNYYHIYARGINKCAIFMDQHDINTFKYLLKKYAQPDFKEHKSVFGYPVSVKSNSISDHIEINAYCLMNNHYHLIIKNLKEKGISKLMQRVLPSYTQYYNKKYNRQGPLVQGGYRSVHLNTEELLIYVARYIHLNPFKANIVKKVEYYPYSSYHNYLYNKNSGWLKINDIILNSTEWNKIENYSGKVKKNENLGLI